MRFKRWPRVSAYEDTARKRAAFHRSQRQQRERLPLLADLIAEQQPSVEAEMARRAVWWPEQQQEDRDRRARAWRRARARLAAYGGNLRPILRQLWRECPYPADPACLLDLLHGVDTGRIDPERPPWKHPRALKPRVTPNPATFDEAFRQIGSRQVGGGPKTTEADEFIFVGNVGSGLVFLVSRVRLINPHFLYGRPLRCKARCEAYATWSGAFMYAACRVRPCMTAGPDGSRGSTPHHTASCYAPETLRALSIPGPTGRAITSSPPSQLLNLFFAADDYAACATDDRNASSRVIRAQATRAILFASAMMTTRDGRRDCNPASHASPTAARVLA